MKKKQTNKMFSLVINMTIDLCIEKKFHQN